MSTANTETCSAPGAPTTGTAHPVGRTLTVLLPAIVGLYGVYQALTQVLLPAQIAAIAPDDKVRVLAVASLAGGILGTIFLPLGASISDRTRTRFGRRTPWLLITSVAVLPLSLALGAAPSVALTVPIYALVCLFANWYQGTIYAVVPDRIPERDRGVASTVIGLGLPLGILIFVNAVARMSQLAGCALIGGFLVAATVLFVLVAPERPAGQPQADLPARARPRWADGPSFFASFRHWDFTMAFLSRLSVFFGFFAMASYSYYVLSDFIGAEALPAGDVPGAVATLATVSTTAQIIAVLVFGKLADYLDRRKLIVGLAALMLALAFVIPLVTPTWWGMVLYNVVAGAAMGVYFAVDVAVMSLVLPDPKNAGRDLGILAIATSIPAMLAGALGSALIGDSGNYAALFVFGIVTSTLGGLGTLMIRRVR